MIPIVGSDACNSAESYSGRITGTMLCAGDGTHDSCQGDSGGPLVVTDENTKYVAGIVSWGDGCGRPKKYGAYTKAPAFADWITKKTKAVAQK